MTILIELTPEQLVALAAMVDAAFTSGPMPDYMEADQIEFYEGVAGIIQSHLDSLRKAGPQPAQAAEQTAASAA